MVRLNRRKLITVISHLIRIMTVVDKKDKPIAMMEYYDDSWKIDCDTTIHTCDTPACVVGYAALDTQFKKSLGVNCKVEYERRGTINAVACKCWGQIKMCHEDGEELSRSLFASYATRRKESAFKLFRHAPAPLRNQILKLAHLNRDDPNPKNVLTYLNHLKSALEKGYICND